MGLCVTLLVLTVFVALVFVLRLLPVCAQVSDLRAKVQYYRERLSVYEALPEESLGDRRARAREWGRKSGGRGRSHGDQVGRFGDRHL